MSGQLDLRRVIIFCVIAYAFAGATAGYLALSGGLSGDVTVIPALASMAIVVVGYMAAPMYAHILTRLVTREGWRDLKLRPRLRAGWPAWLGAWFLPGILTVAGGIVYFLMFPRHYDPELGQVKALLDQAAAQTGQRPPFSPLQTAGIQALVGMLLAPLLNALPTFGEEFGWRAYLQPKLMVLGWRRAMLWMGLIWGTWHWPILALGHNYGLDYPGAPWLGMLTFVWFTLTAGTVLGWLTLRGGSVWPAVIGHGAINGIAALAILFAQGDYSLLLGPAPFGLVGSIPLTVVAIWMWLNPPTTPAQSGAAVAPNCAGEPSGSPA